LIRLRIEFTAPDGGRFDLENAQRFSNRFSKKVANVTDVVQYYRKKVMTRKAKTEVEMPEHGTLTEFNLDSIKVEKLVREFLAAQTLSILPQNSFGEAVGQFVDKDDRNAMDDFVKTALNKQWSHLIQTDGDDNAIEEAMDQHKSTLEELFAAGYMNKRTKRKIKPKPDTWDSEMDGHWSDQPEAFYRAEVSEGENDNDDADSVSTTTRGSARGRGRGRGRAGGRAAATTTTQKTAAATKTNAATSKITRGRKQIVEEEDDQESDIQMLLHEDDESESESMFVRHKKTPAARSSARTAPASKKTTPAPSQATRQSKLAFSQPSRKANGPGAGTGRRAAQESIVISDDEISDDDAFEPAPTASRRR
jgi:double-strand break repair protein MRE11